MTLAGIIAKTETGKPVQDECPDCRHTEQVAIVDMNVVHIFGISLFPVSFKKGVRCQSCRLRRYEGEINKDVYYRIKTDFMGPRQLISVFFGTIILFSSLFLYILLGDIGSWETRRHLDEPEINELYVVNLKALFPGIQRNHYSLVRLVHVDENGIYFQKSSYGYQSITLAKMDVSNGKLEDEDYFKAEPVLFDPSLLKKMKNSRWIRYVSDGN